MFFYPENYYHKKTKTPSTTYFPLKTAKQSLHSILPDGPANLYTKTIIEISQISHIQSSKLKLSNSTVCVPSCLSLPKNHLEISPTNSVDKFLLSRSFWPERNYKAFTNPIDPLDWNTITTAQKERKFLPKSPQSLQPICVINQSTTPAPSSKKGCFARTNIFGFRLSTTYFTFQLKSFHSKNHLITNSPTLLHFETHPL